MRREQEKSGAEARPSALSFGGDRADTTAELGKSQRREPVILRADSACWFTHEFSAKPGVDQAVTSHRKTRAAFSAAYRALPDYPDHLVELSGHSA